MKFSSLFFRKVLAFGMAMLIAIPQNLLAQSNLDPYFANKVEDLNPEVARNLIKQYGRFQFNPEKSKYWPQTAVQEAYAWAAEKTPEVKELPAEEINATFQNLLLILKMAQNGYTQIALKEIPDLTIEMLHLSTSVGKISGDVLQTELRKEEILGEIMRSQIEWALVSLGHLNLAEKKRIEFVLGSLGTFWASEKNLKAFITKENRSNYVQRVSRAIMLCVAVGITMVGADAFGMWSNNPQLRQFINDWALVSPFVGGFLASLLVDSIPKRLSRKVERVRIATREFLNGILLPNVNPKSQFAPADSESLNDLSNLQQEKTDFLKSAVRPLNESEIVDFLASPKPTISDAESFFRTGTATPELIEYYNRLINQNSDLTQLASKGHDFRSNYFAQVSEAFGSMDQNWALDPDLEILKELKRLGSAQSPQMQEIKIQRAQKLALEETRTQFGLNQTTEVDDLERGRFQDPHMASAYDYFKRRFFQYQSREELSPQQQKQEVEEFKEAILDRLSGIREKNFQSAVSTFTNLNQYKSVKLKFKNSEGKPVSISVSELVDVKIDFHVQAKGAEHLLEGAGYVRRLGESDQTADVWFYIPKVSVLNKFQGQTLAHVSADASQFVQLTLKSGQKLLLTEADFNLLLFRLNPFRPLSDVKMATQKRFLLEASRRDTLYSDTLRSLFEKNDLSMDALRSRVQKKVIAKAPADSESISLTERIIYLNRETSHEQNRLDDVRWSGYAVHADHWRARNVLATLNGSVRYTRLTNDKQPMSDQERRSLKGMPWVSPKVINAHDTIPDRSKFIPNLGKGALAFAVAFFFSPAALDLYMKTIYPEIAPHLPSIFFKSPDQLANNVGDGIGRLFGGLTGSGGDSGSSGADSMKKSGNDSEKENNKKEDEKGKSGDSDKGQIKKGPTDPKQMPRVNEPKKAGNVGLDEHQNGKKQILYKITPIQISEDKIPSYMNLMSEKNQPQGLDEGILSDRSDILEIKTDVQMVRKADFSIETQLPVAVPKSGIVPIISPPGYRVAELMVYTYGKDGYKSSGMAVPFQVKSTGLQFMKVYGADRENQVYYQAWYKKYETASPDVIPPMRKDIILQLNVDLRKLGATQLSNMIEFNMQDRNQIAPSQFAEVFSYTGTYTYDKELVLQSVPQNPYGDYAKFLRNGELFYQCTGSNMLFGEFMSNYYKMTNDPVKITNVVGFVREGTQVLGSSGHLHNIIYRTDQNWASFDLDATPRKMDPKYEKMKKDSPLDEIQREKERQKKAEEEKKRLEEEKLKGAESKNGEKTKKNGPQDPLRQDQNVRVLYAIRSEAIDIKKLKRFPTPESDEENENDSAVLRRRKRTEPRLTPEKLKENIEELEKVRARYLSAIQKRAAADTEFNSKPQKSKLPGLKILQIVPVVLEMAEGKISVKSGLLFLAGVDLGVDLKQLQDPRAKKTVEDHLHELSGHLQDDAEILEAIIGKFKVEFEDAIRKESAQMTSQKSRHAYLLDPKLQNELREGLKILLERRWILDRDPDSHSATSCAHQLGG